MQGTTHIIGAGLAGLSAATRLAQAGGNIVLYEAAGQAGGRCRSYYDETFGGVIDNGNHLLLSGNDAAFSYLKRIGAEKKFMPADKAIFDFVDAGTLQRWRLHINPGIFPLWLFDKNRRVPDTGFTDYLAILRLLMANPTQAVGQLLACNTNLYRRLWHTLFISALNTEPEQASAPLAGAILRGTLLKGGRACIPFVAEGLSSALIDPALRYLRARNQPVLFNRRLTHIHIENGNATRLDFATGEPVSIPPADNIICAVPSWGVNALMPDIETPDTYNAILNAHFRIEPPASFPKIMGVIGATTEWIFAFPGRISITVSAANRLMQEEREVLASRIWQEVAAITGLAKTLPPWQIVKEKRASFAATPEQDAKRPGTKTAWSNILLAGDWVQTGLPATIEGALRSGVDAAELIMKKS